MYIIEKKTLYTGVAVWQKNGSFTNMKLKYNVCMSQWNGIVGGTHKTVDKLYIRQLTKRGLGKGVCRIAQRDVLEHNDGLLGVIATFCMKYIKKCP